VGSVGGAPRVVLCVAKQQHVGRSGAIAGRVRRGRLFVSEFAATVDLTGNDWFRNDVPDYLWRLMIAESQGNSSLIRFVRWQGAVQADLKNQVPRGTSLPVSTAASPAPTDWPRSTNRRRHCARPRDRVLPCPARTGAGQVGPGSSESTASTPDRSPRQVPRSRAGLSGCNKQIRMTVAFGASGPGSCPRWVRGPTPEHLRPAERP
jgi:hypothetical protein